MSTIQPSFLNDKKIFHRTDKRCIYIQSPKLYTEKLSNNVVDEYIIFNIVWFINVKNVGNVILNKNVEKKKL